MLAEDAQIQLVRPPVTISRPAACRLFQNAACERAGGAFMVEGGYDVGWIAFYICVAHESCSLDFYE